MTQAVQAKCPHCKQILRIPGEWLDRPMRCKHCQQVFQARSKSATPMPPVARPVVPPLPPAPPAGIPVGKLVSAGPARAAGPPPLPKAAPAGASPFAFTSSPPPLPPAPPAAIPLGPPPAKGSAGWLKGTLVGVGVLGVAAVLTIVFGKSILGLKDDPADKSTAHKPTDELARRDKDGTRDKKADGSRDSKPAPKPQPNKDRKPTPTPDKSVKKDKATPPDPNKDRPVAKDKPAKDKFVKPPRDGVVVVKNPPVKDRPSADKQPRDKPVVADKPQPKDKPAPSDKPVAKDNPVVTDKPPKDKPAPKDKPVVKDRPNPKDVVKPKDDKKPPVKPKPARPEEFPRRALVISVNNYLYANPLQYGRQNANTGDLLTMFQRFLHFPRSQLTELSDGAPGDRAHPPVKAVIEQTITDFLAGSRPMDRVVLLFTGHAVEVDKAVYLVPVEGDLGDAATLIPLSWVYEKLVKCPARQKVFIIDVCRFDPARGDERASAGAMGDVLDAALKKPPEGIQVWSSCVAKELSYDLFQGSLFLEAICTCLEKKAVNATLEVPSDPIPLELLQAKVSEYVQTMQKRSRVAQTTRLTGKDPGKGAAYDPDADPAPPLVIKPAPGFEGGAAGREMVQGILDEVGQFPSAKGGPIGKALRFETMPPFPAKVMKKYKADYASLEELDQKLKDNPKDFKLIRAVRNATKALLDNSSSLPLTFPGKQVPIPPQVKNQVIKRQSALAKNILDLQDALDGLKKASAEREKEDSLRWAANYDYVLAKVTARLIYLREYSLMLGKIRKDELPNLEAGQNGWRLVSAAKLQSTDKDIKELVAELKDALKGLKKNYKGTPYEILARREQGTYLGLEWKPNGS